MAISEKDLSKFFKGEQLKKIQNQIKLRKNTAKTRAQKQIAEAVDVAGLSSPYFKGNVAEDRLFSLVKKVFCDGFEVAREVKLVPGRRYSSDVVAKPIKKTPALISGLAFELDGYRHHGLSLTGFKRDREKDRLVLLNGFVTVRFFASEVLKNESGVISVLEELKVRYFGK